MTTSEFATDEIRALIIHVLHWIAITVQVVGVSAIIVGALVATTSFVRQGVVRGWQEALRQYRANLGRGILLGLEFLVAADIIDTVAVTPTVQNLSVLGMIIVVRTLLSFALEVEIDGCLPWRRREAERGDVADRAA